MSLHNHATGTMDGTGTAISVSLGFTPNRIRVLNTGTSDAGKCELQWVTGMANASAIKRKTSTFSTLSSNGITVDAGDDDTPSSFTIGADADVNVSGEAITWEAFGD